MHPFALAGAAHHQKVTLSRKEHNIVACIGTGNRVSPVASRPQLKWARVTKHEPSNQGVVQPLQRTIAVTALEVVPISVIERRCISEANPIVRRQMQRCLPEGRVEIREPQMCAETPLRHCMVIAPDFRLLPFDLCDQFLKQALGIANEPRCVVTPRTGIQLRNTMRIGSSAGLLARINLWCFDPQRNSRRFEVSPDQQFWKWGLSHGRTVPTSAPSKYQTPRIPGTSSGRSRHQRLIPVPYE